MSGQTHCSVCDSDAAVRVRGNTLCGSCALGFDTIPPAATTPPRSQLAPQLVSVLGAVVATIAAIGTVASFFIAAPRSAGPDDAAAPELAPNSVAATALDSGAVAVVGQASGDIRVDQPPAADTAVVAAAEEAIEMATALVAATRTWADCVVAAATGDDPTHDIDTCGAQPTPDEYDVDTTIIAAGSVPPGQVVNEDAEALPPGATSTNQEDPLLTATANPETPAVTDGESGGLPPGQVMKEDPEALPPGQVMKEDPEALPPGQVMKEDPEALPPGQAAKE